MKSGVKKLRVVLEGIGGRRLKNCNKLCTHIAKDGVSIDYKATVDFSFKLEKNPPVRVRMEAPDK